MRLYITECGRAACFHVVNGRDVLQSLEQGEEEVPVVCAYVAHGSAHAREGLAVAQVIVGIVFGRFALRPVPMRLVKVHDRHIMFVYMLSLLQGEVLGHGQGFFENHGRHHG